MQEELRWVEVNCPVNDTDPSIIMSRFYTRVDSKTRYPMIVIDADRENIGSDVIKAAVLMCDNDEHCWMTHKNAPEWTIPEIKELINLAEKEVKLMREYA